MSTVYKQKPMLGQRRMYIPGHPLGIGEKGRLIAHYLFNEGSGDIVCDCTGNGYHGSLTGMEPATDWGSGEMGTCLNFPGNDDEIAISGTMGLGTVNVSMIAWFYHPAGGCEGTLIKVGNSSSGYGILASTVGPPWHSELRGLYEGVRWIDTNTNFAEDQWNQAAMVIDSAGLPFMYMNGQPINSYAGAGPKQPAGDSGIAGYGIRYLAAGHPIAVVSVYARGLRAGEVERLCHDPYCMFAPIGWQPWMQTAAAGVTVTPSVATMGSSLPTDLATGGAVIAANLASLTSEAITGETLGGATIGASAADMIGTLPTASGIGGAEFAASVTDITGGLPAASATGGATIAPAVLSVIGTLPAETIITGAVVAVDPVTAAITVLAVVLRTGEVVPPLHLTNLQRQFVHVVDLRRQDIRLDQLGRGDIHADLD